MGVKRMAMRLQAAWRAKRKRVPFDRLPGKPGQAGKLPPDPMENCL